MIMGLENRKRGKAEIGKRGELGDWKIGKRKAEKRKTGKRRKVANNE
jgi:hypothetical protein